MGTSSAPHGWEVPVAYFLIKKPPAIGIGRVRSECSHIVLDLKTGGVAAWKVW